jgi:hypothetical protein
VLAAAVASCNQGPAVGDVVGEVTLDGQPLADGVIHFTPADGNTPTKSTFISGGKFAQQVPVGIQKIQVSSVQVAPARPGQAADSLQGRELVPERYNTRSELKTEIKAGKNPLKLELTTK